MTKQALPGKRLNAFAMDPKDLVIIGLDTNDGPEHPRWDERTERTLKEETIVNFMEIGVREPVTVVKVDGVAEVVNGRRRVMHAREANRRLRKLGEKELLLVPVMLARGDDDLMEQLGISLNEHREDDGLMTKIDKAVRMLARNGDDFARAAMSFGVSTQTIRTWMKIAGVSSKVRKAIEAGSISATAAAKLAPLARAEQDEELAKLTKSGKATARAAGAAARRKNGNGEGLMAPTKRDQKKVVKAFSEREDTDLEPEFIRGVRWAIGDLAPEAVKGLKAILNE